MISILSKNQKQLLAALGAERSITNAFYLSGGTALAEYYLHHRYSEDLDFFSEREFDPQSISVVLKKLQQKTGIERISYEQSFNRNLFLLALKNDTIKTEFTYFPFPRIEPAQKKDGIAVDSLIDIAVNKLFTIFQKPRSRDFIDLYAILHLKKEWGMDELTKQAQIKFDCYLEPIQLAGQYMKAETLMDLPRMVADIPETKWRDFFLTAAQALTKTALL